jgi:hypothetical protein
MLTEPLRLTQSLEASVPPDMTPLAVAPAENVRYCVSVSVSAVTVCVTATGAQIISAYLCLHVCHGWAVVRNSISAWQSVAMRSGEEGEVPDAVCISSYHILTLI